MEKRIYYHYCSVDTFFNIMQTSTIRLGNPLFMNDSAEIICLLELLKNYVAKNKNCPEILKKWSLIKQMINKLLQKIDLPFIFCLSKGNDVLSQWRSYADDGKGVAIGIDVNRLLKLDTELLTGKDIIYDDKEQMKLLEQKKLDDSLDDFIEELEMVLPGENETEIYSKVRKVASYILNEAIICKNPAFEEEREFRILCSPSKVSEKSMVSEIKFRSNNKQILPYREIYFDGYAHEIIQNITIGPKSVLNDRNLGLFLKKHGLKWLDETTELPLESEKWTRHIEVSKATYR